MDRLIAGDERAVYEFWQTYGKRLNRLAEKHLAPRLRRRVEGDDVVQSVCRTFFRRAKMGQYEIADVHSLWSLLCRITVLKAAMTARKHTREKRSFERDEFFGCGADSGEFFPAAENQPTPDQVVMMAEELENTLGLLDEQQRQVVDMRLQDYKIDEIAAQLKCSDRTVRRILRKVRHRLDSILQDSMLDIR